jgi:hypothetical protein
VPGVCFGVDAFKQSALGAARMEGVPVRITTTSHNYFGYPREQVFADTKATMPAIIEALTKPLAAAEKKVGPRQQVQPHRIQFKGTLDEVQYFFIKNQWTDGLPIIPPTEDRVEKMLAGTSQPPDKVLGLMGPEFWEVTVEKVAINAVMAGCKPEYLPVVLAATGGAIEKDQRSWMVSATSIVPMYLVNGPIRNEIGMNAGLGAQGPGNQANASIGRAIMLCQINLGGWWPGRNALGSQGHPAQYTFCVPENEEQSPWEPFHVDMGYQAEESVLSLFVEYGGMCGGCEGMRRTIPKSLSNIQRPFQATVLLDPSLAQIISDEGFTKQELQKWLWENTTETFEEWWQDPFLPNFIEKNIGEPGYWPERYKKGNLPPDTIVPKFPSPESINVIVIGGGSKVLYQTGGNKYRFSASIDRWR